MYLVKNKKSPYYQVVYKRDGRLTSKSTGAKVKSEAFKFLYGFKDKINTNSRLSSILLEDFKDEYVNYLIMSKSKDYIRSVKLSFNQIIKFTGNICLENVNVKIIDEFINTTYNRSQHASNLYYRTLKAGFSKALIWNYISFNPLDKIKMLKPLKSLPVFITLKELQLIVRETRKSFLKDLFLIAFHTGMRLGELVNLRWQSVSLKNRLVKVEHQEKFTTKSKKERIIPLNTTSFEILIRRYIHLGKVNSSDYVFYRIIGVRLTRDYVSKKFKQAVRTARLNDKIKFHSLRHSFASNLAQLNVSLLTLKELLGHESCRT
ncbi:tyrosine-type recombinase/integrase, partial [Bacteroidota bacterium]